MDSNVFDFAGKVYTRSNPTPLANPTESRLAFSDQTLFLGICGGLLAASLGYRGLRGDFRELFERGERGGKGKKVYPTKRARYLTRFNGGDAEDRERRDGLLSRLSRTLLSGPKSAAAPNYDELNALRVQGLRRALENTPEGDAAARTALTDLRNALGIECEYHEGTNRDPAAIGFVLTLPIVERPAQATRTEPLSPTARAFLLTGLARASTSSEWWRAFLTKIAESSHSDGSFGDSETRESLPDHFSELGLTLARPPRWRDASRRAGWRINSLTTRETSWFRLGSTRIWTQFEPESLHEAMDRVFGLEVAVVDESNERVFGRKGAEVSGYQLVLWRGRDLVRCHELCPARDWTRERRARVLDHLRDPSLFNSENARASSAFPLVAESTRAFRNVYLVSRETPTMFSRSDPRVLALERRHGVKFLTLDHDEAETAAKACVYAMSEFGRCEYASPTPETELEQDPSAYWLMILTNTPEEEVEGDEELIQLLRRL